jgi:hypothetical protein
VEFDESNGSQGDGFCYDDVGKEPLREAMKKMAIGDINQRRRRILTPFMNIPSLMEGVQGLQQTIQLILSSVIPRVVQGLTASNMPHFANIMLLSLL